MESISYSLYFSLPFNFDLILSRFIIFTKSCPNSFNRKMEKQERISLLESVNSSRNYLTLVVLLIAALCLALAYAFSAASASLDAIQRWFFILLLAFFPILGLTVSIWLILRQSRKLAVSRKDGAIEWRITSAEKQQQKLNSEVLEIARRLEVSENQLSDLRSAYIVAEDLALRHIEKEAQIPLMRHVTLGEIEFDAVLINQETIKCVEVTFLVAPQIHDEKINRILKKTEAIKRELAKIRPDTKLILMLALVTQLDRMSEAKLRSTIADKFIATPVDVDIRLFDFEELQKVFTT